MTAEAWSAIATGVAAFAALFIAVWQHWAQLRVMAGVQREKASCIAITDWDAHSVTVKNFGSTPFFRVRVHNAKADMQQGPGPAWEMPVVGEASAGGGSPDTRWTLGSNETVQFDLVGWVDDLGGTPLSQEQVESLQRPTVTLRYRDAAGTRWERTGHDRPEPTGGGTPLPGAFGIRDRCKFWWRRYRVWKRSAERRRDRTAGGAPARRAQHIARHYALAGHWPTDEQSPQIAHMA
jgi:hypothetical protein